MTARDIIVNQGGPAAFRRALAERGVFVPQGTVDAWSARGGHVRHPAGWVLPALLAVLKHVPVKTPGVRS